MTVRWRRVACAWAASLRLLFTTASAQGQDPAEFAEAWQPPVVTGPVLDARFVDGDGTVLTLDRWQGQALLVNFWATWCIPCVTELPSLDRLAAHAPDDLAVVGISVDRSSLDHLHTFFDRLGIDHLAVHQDRAGLLAGALSVRAFPTSVLFDHDGVPIGQFIGDAQWDGPEALAYLEETLSIEIAPVD